MTAGTVAVDVTVRLQDRIPLRWVDPHDGNPDMLQTKHHRLRSVKINPKEIHNMK